MTNIDSILKSRDITLPTNVRLVKAIVFPLVMDGCKNQTIKKAERQRIDTFELWYWKRLLRVPWTARRSNQSILKEINPEYSLEGLKPKLRLKLQYFGHLMWRIDCWKRPWYWKDWGQEEKGMTEDEMVGWHHWLSRHELELTLRDSEGQGSLACCRPQGHKEQTRIGNWTTTTNPPGLTLFTGPRITVFSLPSHRAADQMDFTTSGH